MEVCEIDQIILKKSIMKFVLADFNEDEMPDDNCICRCINATFFSVQSNDLIDGFIAFEPDGEICYIAIKKSFRRTGSAKHLISRAYARLQREGVNTMTAKNVSSKYASFFRAEGFEFISGKYVKQEK